MPKLALDWGNVLTSKVPKNRHVSMEQGFRGLAEVRQQNSHGTCGTPTGIAALDELAQMAGFYVLTGSILLAVTVIFSRALCRMRRKAFGFSYGRAS